jgi:thiamine-phosphate pyrophosphorylase
VIRCLVTDRRRLAGAGASFDHARRLLLAQLESAVTSGVDFIQIRERDLEAGDLAALVEAVVSLVRGTTSHVVVNDRLDVALACGAGGVHLRGDSIAATEARRIVPGGFLIGRSVHTAGEAAAAGDCDYVIAGTVFPSPSKAAGAPVLGIDGLRQVVSASRAPVLAIGGVTADRFDAIAATGAAGVAGIGLFLPFDSPTPAP